MKISLLLAISNSFSQTSPSIEWMDNTRQFLGEKWYGRVKKLSNGDLALVYNSETFVTSIRFSKDKGKTWSPGSTLIIHPGFESTNAELIELKNGWLVFGFNDRPLKQDSIFHFAIEVKVSKDKGMTWGNEHLVYQGGNNWGTGCWEPAFIQLPSGELQVYFANETPFVRNNDQEIGMMKSFDNGATWGQYTRVCYRMGSRDGMPVPLLAKNGKDILVSIEDNGADGSPFKPVIVKTTVQENWSNGPVVGESRDRWLALDGPSRLSPGDFGAAPYIAQFPSGETVLSFSSTQGRPIDQNRMKMQVYLGDEQGKNFVAQPAPFDVSTDGAGNFNSLGIIDDSTVVAVSSIFGPVNPGGIWIVMGRLKRSQPVDISIRSRDGRDRSANSLFYNQVYKNNIRLFSLESRIYAVDGKQPFPGSSDIGRIK